MISIVRPVDDDMNAATETSLADERVIVIDGCSDIGISTARAVADRGGETIVTRQPEPSVRENHTEPARHEDEKRNENENENENGLVAADRDLIEVHELDSTDEAAVEAFFEDIDEFDHVVCAADYVPTGGPVETDTESFRDVFDVVFWGSYYAAKHSVKRLGDEGTVTFVSGNAASRPSVQFFAMGVANAAVETLAKYLAVEIGPVRVNAVSPGRVDRVGMSDDTQESLAESVPAKRIGNPEDIAAAILFAVMNPHTTGTVIRVDGGDILV